MMTLFLREKIKNEIKKTKNREAFIEHLIFVYLEEQERRLNIKLFNKYIKDEDNSILEIYCDNLKRDEIKELLTLLEDLRFKYISTDTKSIKAVKEAHFREIYQAKKRLEKEGFSWSEKQEVTK